LSKGGKLELKKEHPSMWSSIIINIGRQEPRWLDFATFHVRNGRDNYYAVLYAAPVWKVRPPDGGWRNAGPGLADLLVQSSGDAGEIAAFFNMEARCVTGLPTVAVGRT
jgi:hypothetical protein